MAFPLLFRVRPAARYYALSVIATAVEGDAVTAFTWWMFYILAPGLMCLASRICCTPSHETSGKA